MGLITGAMSTSTDMSQGKNPIEGAKAKVNDTLTMIELSKEGNPGKVKLKPEQIETLVKDSKINKKVREAAVNTYVCTDATGCTDMPAPTFENLQKRLRGEPISK